MSEKVRAADRPRGAELLAVARRALLEELVPALPEDRRYQALMVANALAIAGRELAQPDREDPAALEALAAAIRAGRHDGDAVIHARLLAWATARTAVTNPKALK
jgi:hypothetical protein